MSLEGSAYVDSQIHRVALTSRRGGIFLLVLVAAFGAIKWKYWLGYISPTTVDIPADPAWSAIVLGMMLLVASIGVYRIVQAARWLGRPSLHPIWRQLEQFGEPTELARQLSAEAPTARVVGTSPRFLFTASGYLLIEKTHDLPVLRIDDLVWAYKVVTQHSVNYVPTHASSKVRLVDRRERQLDLELTSGAADALLAELAACAPWLLNGWTDELQLAWTTDPHSVIARVERERSASSTTGA